MTPLKALIVAALALGLGPGSAAAEDAAKSYSPEEIYASSEGFFGETTEGLAKVIEKVFSDLGRPNAYIAGEEFAGAIGIGLRYGKGTLHRKDGSGAREVYWQGPSIGFDFGANAAKAFVLVYHLADSEKLYQRFPGVEGTAYFVGGVGVNYQQSGDIILAPIRLGVGLRAGANIGYLHYNQEFSWLPF